MSNPDWILDRPFPLMLSLDAGGAVKASFLYGPFGEVVSESGASSHRRQFNGKENDVASGLRYYGARHYDALALRWVSGDPLYRFAPDVGLADPQRTNLYTFSLNNPLKYYDPDGRDVIIAYGRDLESGYKHSRATAKALAKALAVVGVDSRVVKADPKSIRKARAAIQKDGGKVSALVAIQHSDGEYVYPNGQRMGSEISPAKQIRAAGSPPVVVLASCGACLFASCSKGSDVGATGSTVYVPLAIGIESKDDGKVSTDGDEPMAPSELPIGRGDEDEPKARKLFDVLIKAENSFKPKPAEIK